MLRHRLLSMIVAMPPLPGALITQRRNRRSLLLLRCCPLPLAAPPLPPCLPPPLRARNHLKTGGPHWGRGLSLRAGLALFAAARRVRSAGPSESRFAARGGAPRCVGGARAPAPIFRARRAAAFASAGWPLFVPLCSWGCGPAAGRPQGGVAALRRASPRRGAARLRGCGPCAPWRRFGGRVLVRFGGRCPRGPARCGTPAPGGFFSCPFFVAYPRNLKRGAQSILFMPHRRPGRALYAVFMGAGVWFPILQPSNRLPGAFPAQYVPIAPVCIGNWNRGLSSSVPILVSPSRNRAYSRISS